MRSYNPKDEELDCSSPKYVPSKEYTFPKPSFLLENFLDLIRDFHKLEPTAGEIIQYFPQGSRRPKDDKNTKDTENNVYYEYQKDTLRCPSGFIARIYIYPFESRGFKKETIFFEHGSVSEFRLFSEQEGFRHVINYPIEKGRINGTIIDEISTLETDEDGRPSRNVVSYERTDYIDDIRHGEYLYEDEKILIEGKYDSGERDDQWNQRDKNTGIVEGKYYSQGKKYKNKDEYITDVYTNQGSF